MRPLQTGFHTLLCQLPCIISCLVLVVLVSRLRESTVWRDGIAVFRWRRVLIRGMLVALFADED